MWILFQLGWELSYYLLCYKVYLLADLSYLNFSNVVLIAED